MKAVILAGGYGKRLRPLTDEKPKPLVEIGGKPILEWQILLLKRYKISSVYILAGYKKEVLLDWVSKNQERLEVKLAILSETEPLGTGGAIKRLEDFIKEPFYVLNGDIITNLDLDKLKISEDSDDLASIALVPLKSPYGIIRMKDGGKIIEFVEKPIIKDYWINAGIYYMKPQIFEFLPVKGDVEKTTFPLLAEKGILSGKTYDSVYWRSIDTLKDYEEAGQEVSEVFKNL
ncbi:nucleotidyltransferase family protein [Sulfolobus acidocaldarius]|uniref:Nucleotidyl transferase n=4 Tax=Sulfolobus acidocaldarius TaxID=2285 RepID=Q4J9C5_SULAC|nr:nucleotidyltransferase family protein [Sulfolobus acidocaldarius]AAY80604.1 nucleotidyl transferase [Sulfolobus acidocaldarius DSM 639]AGE71195.1 nucleotidyl transferase [Sulfolobus acidocaldarius N8]AGE73465.1 nucleotidyl transferase [Sulfolobus acidocaldarius Ron12/I]ALU28540.1 nucleotidyltransferase [Sulfolobus acidocaldarius]ALU31251.1 nucleotidyltransferase [Sulfolobus acidocaldarius]